MSWAIWQKHLGSRIPFRTQSKTIDSYLSKVVLSGTPLVGRMPYFNNEWGFELECALMSGSLHTGPSPDRYNFAPVYGLFLHDMGYSRSTVLEPSRYWLVPMRWVAFWFKKENLDLLNRHGAKVLPNVANRCVDVCREEFLGREYFTRQLIRQERVYDEWWWRLPRFSFR
jgi:hypothetical protein